MPVVLRLLALALPFSACSSSFRSDDDTGGGTGGGNDTDDGGPGGTGLPDLTDDLDTTGCDVIEATGDEHPGAASYFYGELSQDGDEWSGLELWLLYANPSWENDDCQVYWSVSASETSTGACTACDLGLAVAMTLDESQTTCPEDLWQDERNLTEEYAVLLSDDGTSTWYFGGSGTQFGAGYHDDDALNFVTEKTCTWF